MARLLLRDLTPGTNYKIQLRAVEGDSVSEWSRLFDLIATSDNSAPDAPSLTSWTAVGDSFVAVWSAINTSLDKNRDFSRYEIEIGNGTVTKIVSLRDTTYTLSFEQNRAFFTNPAPTVTARIRSVDAVGNVSAWSGTASATNPAPQPVTGLVATSQMDAIALSWTPPSDVDVIGYNVYTSTDAKVGFTAATSFQYTTTTYSAQTMKVAAVDKFGQESTRTVSNSVTPSSPFVTDPNPPVAPTNLAVSIANNANGIGARASLTWNLSPVPSDLAGFSVRYRKVGETVWSNINFPVDNTGTAGAFAGTIELQAAYTNYEFQINAYDWQANESPWTATVTGTSPGAGTPAQITGLASTPGRDNMRYTWNAATEANLKEYEVTFSTSSTFASGNITFKTSTPYLVVSGLNPATTYYARVRAINVAGTAGAFSATDTKATLAQLTPGDIGAPTTSQFNTAVKNYSVEYAVNSSETTAPTTGWATTQPTRTAGQFIWTRTVVTYQDNTTSTTAPALITGNSGSNGVGVSSTVIEYQVGTSGTSAPTGAWSTTPVATTAAGQYLWTRTTTNYTDNTSSVGYSVAAHGATGSAGGAGRGISSTVVNYQVGTSGTTAPTGTWSTTPVATTAAGQYLWTRTVTNYTDGLNPTTAYSVSAHGATGGAGSAGTSISSVVPYFAQVTAGTTPTQPPAGTATPAAPWTTTEPNYVANTDLWRTEKITYSNGTISYTTQTKVSSYAAASTAMAAANGKNKVVYSTGDASGTTHSSGYAYVDGDIWYKRDANGVVIGQWEYVSGGTPVWQARTLSDAVLSSLSVGKLVSGDVSAITINIKATGSIKSDNYVPNSTGWKLDASGLELNSGTVKAEALKAGTLGGPSGSGILNIAAGTSLVLNGGYMKSNTYTVAGAPGTSFSAAATAGFYLGNDGLVIASGTVKAEAFAGGTFTAGTINIGSGGRIQGGSWYLDNTGLFIPNGAIDAGKITLQEGANIIPADYADFEFLPTHYNAALANEGSPISRAIVTSATAAPKVGNQSLQITWSGGGSGYGGVILGVNSTSYNVPVEPGKTYILSFYAMTATGTGDKTVRTWRATEGSGPTYLPESRVLVADGTWQRLSYTWTPAAGQNNAVFCIRLLTAGTIYVDAVQVEEKVSASVTPSTWSRPGATSINGYQIRTGEIRSVNDTNVNGVNEPVWSIPLNGAATFSAMRVLGNTVLGNGNLDTTSRLVSSNYSPNAAGWMIRADGFAEFSNVTIRESALAGNITSSATITGGTFTTGAAGTQRVAMTGTNFTYYSGSSAEVTPGSISVQATNVGFDVERHYVSIRGPLIRDWANGLSSQWPQISMYTSTRSLAPTSGGVGYPSQIIYKAVDHYFTNYTNANRVRISDAIITAEDGNGDEIALQSKRLHLTSTNPAGTGANNQPPLRIGSLSGVHLRIDGNGITGMKNDNTQGDFTLQVDNFIVNAVNGGCIIQGGSNIRGKIRASGDLGAAVIFKDAGVGISPATANPLAFNASTTANFHAAQITSYTGGIFMDDLSAGGTTNAQINNNGRIIRATSSKRYKSYVEPMKFEDAKKALGLEAVTFFLRSEADMKEKRIRYPGFIAEQAHDAGMNLWVQYNGDGLPDGFRYGELTAAHNMLIKDLYDENAALKAEVESLKATVTSQESRLAQVEAWIQAQV